MDEMMAIFTAANAQSAEVTEMVTSQTTNALSGRIRLTYIVCVRFMIDSLPLHVIPCPYFTNYGYDYDLAHPNSIKDFVDNHCNVKVELKFQTYLDHVVRRSVKIYPASKAYLCTIEEGQYALKQSKDGDFLAFNSNDQINAGMVILSIIDGMYFNSLTSVPPLVYLHLINHSNFFSLKIS